MNKFTKHWYITFKKVKNYNNQLKNKQQWQETYLRLQTRKVQKYSGVTNATKQKHETNFYDP